MKTITVKQLYFNVPINKYLPHYKHKIYPTTYKKYIKYMKFGLLFPAIIVYILCISVC